MEKKLNTILLILAVTIAFIACSQDEQAKSPAIKKGTSQYTIEYIKGISMTQPKRALKMIETGKKDGSITGIDANYLLSIVYNNTLRNYSKAANYAVTAINDPNIDKYPEKKQQLYYMASSQFYSCGNYVGCFNMAEKGIKLAYERKDRKHVAQLLMIIGECHGEVGNMWHALNAFDRCILILTEQIKKTPDWDTYFDLVNAYSLKANSAIDIKEYKLVIDMQPKYKECLDKLNKLKEDVSGANDVANAGYYSLLSIAYEKSGNHAKARECFDNLLSTRTALLPDGASYVVPYLMETKQYKEALKKINEEEKTWMSHGRDTVDYTYSNTILMNKARVLQALGRYEEAINTGMRAYNLSDSLTRRIKEQNATWLSEKMGKKVLKSYIENQDKQLTINRWANIIMGVLLFICITLIVFIIRDNRIIKNKNRVSSSLIGELSKYKTELFDRMSEHPDKVNNAASANDKASATDDKGKAVNSGETVKTEKKTDSKAHNEEYEQFLKIEKMIFEKNLFIRTKLSRTEVAAETGMSTSHFNAVFDKYSQLTFTNYINNLRMERAAKLLKEKPNYSIEAIAKECGVPVRQTFYRLFSKKYGMTPADYRDNI